MKIIRIVFQILAALFMVVVFMKAMVIIIGSDSKTPATDYIAIVDLQGMIVDSSAIIEKFEKLEKDKYAKGYVLRVNSPGGLVTPSQEIEYYLYNLKKPLYVSMGSVAASGGYMSSMPAKKIFAMPGTITGSIGVIMNVPNYTVLMDKIGISEDVIKSGKFKDTGNPSRKMTDEDRKELMNIVMDMYNQFVDSVAKGRSMPREKVLELADGRVYTGKEAKKNGLIDEVGSWQDCYKALAEEIGQPDIKFIKVDDKKGMLSLLDSINQISRNIEDRVKLTEPGIYYMMEF